MSAVQEILFSEYPGEQGNLGMMMLNRPHALNALNHNMVIAMQQQLAAWELDSKIKAVVIQAVPGKAFCSGGDLRAAYEGIKKNDERVLRFFYDEYQLNQQIFNYPKPYIAILNGITMGGGVGISIHGSHRIATEHLVFAMPETGIGFFPDVGGTYFLPRLAHFIGFYLGLSGARLHIEDSFWLRLVTDTIMSKDIPQVIDAIAEAPLGLDPKKTVSQLLSVFAPGLISPPLEKHATFIEQIFSQKTMSEILASLAQSEDSFSQQTLATLLKKSPHSLEKTLAAMHLGLSKNFEQCMQDEYRLAEQFFKHPDFAEGIRAQLIDKDQMPCWLPAKFS